MPICLHLTECQTGITHQSVLKRLSVLCSHPAHLTQRIVHQWHEMGVCLKHTPLLQEILHVEGLDERTAKRLHKTMKGDAAGVTLENLVIYVASVVKVSCRGPSMTYLHHSALS